MAMSSVTTLSIHESFPLNFIGCAVAAANMTKGGLPRSVTDRASPPGLVLPRRRQPAPSAAGKRAPYHDRPAVDRNKISTMAGVRLGHLPRRIGAGMGQLLGELPHLRLQGHDLGAQLQDLPNAVEVEHHDLRETLNLSQARDISGGVPAPAARGTP